jgi:hypothetical protein
MRLPASLTHKKIAHHITTRGGSIKKIKNMAECLYHTFITSLFSWSNFFSYLKI